MRTSVTHFMEGEAEIPNAGGLVSGLAVNGWVGTHAPACCLVGPEVPSVVFVEGGWGGNPYRCSRRHGDRAAGCFLEVTFSPQNC